MREEISICEKMCLMVICESPEHVLNLENITEQLKLKYGKVWKLQTVATFLSRLKNKGYIDTYRIGRYTQYKSLVTKQELLHNDINSLAIIYGYSTNSDIVQAYLKSFESVG